jgi:D-alanyl-D-alanine carboxypeptidase
VQKNSSATLNRIGRFLRIALCLLLLQGFTATIEPLEARAAPRYAALAVDAHTGKVLFARNADAHRYPASLTKIMTLYMLFGLMAKGKINHDTAFVVTPNAAGQAPSKVGFKPGQTIRAIDAIHILVTKSANDVAVVVAENVGGTEANFARMMTQKAREIGMTRTTFKNASGLPNPGQKTTARDMITLSLRLMRDYPQYYSVFKTKYFKYRGRRYRNHNRLLFSHKGTDGIKTGYIRASGFNLVSSVRQGNKHVVAVVFGGKSGKSRNAHMRKILNRTMRTAVAHSGTRRSPPLPDRNPVVVAAAFPTQPVDLASFYAYPSNDVSQAGGVGSKSVSSGDFHVQVGAYSSPSEASAILLQVKSAAPDLLAGHEPITQPYRKPKRQLYRARFAGFTKSSARSACSKLKQRDINCIIMRAK